MEGRLEMKKALMIIDMQIMPFIWKEYGGKTIYNEKNIISNVQELIAKARKANAPIYYIMYTEGEGSPRAEGQQLWQVWPEIANQENDRMIVKYYADSFLKTNLDESLKADGIEEIVMCGVQTEFCVDATVKSAFSHGYKVELVKDAHSTYDSDILSAQKIIEHHNSILEQFAQCVPSKEIEF